MNAFSQPVCQWGDPGVAVTPCQVPAWHCHTRVFRSSLSRGKGLPTKPEPAQEATYLLKRWLSTLILLYALKSSGISMTGTGTLLSSLICNARGK